MWIFSLYSMVDGLFVARGVGEHALAAVNLSMPFTNFIFAVGLLLATGTSTVVSIALGQGDKEQASRYFNQNIWVLTALGLVLTGAVLLNLERVARFLGATDLTLADTMAYTGTIAGFAVFFMVSYNLEVLVKTNGAPHVSAIGVTSCALMNVVLDYVFVMRFGWGVQGAALATGLAQVTSTCIFILYFATHRENLRFGSFRPQLGIYRRIVPIGLADGFTELSNGVVIFLFNLTILSLVGEDGVVSYTVISYLNTLVLMTMSGTTQGIQPLCSFYRGKGELKSIHTILGYGVKTVAVFSLLAFSLVQWKAEAFVGLFIDAGNVELFRYSVTALRLFAPSFLLLGFNVILAGFFASIERPRYSLTISIGRGLVILSLTLFALSSILGDRGVWITQTVSEGLCLLLTLTLCWRYRKEIRSQGGLVGAGGEEKNSH